MTTPDTLAAAERYRKHLEAEKANKLEESPYPNQAAPDILDRFDGIIQMYGDIGLLARAYVERKEQP